jgi:hypothetical protein
VRAFVLYLLALTGCAALLAAAPTGIGLIACVVGDALKGESMAQIALGCSTDIPGVVASLLSPEADKINPAVENTPAMSECKKVIALYSDAGIGMCPNAGVR